MGKVSESQLFDFDPELETPGRLDSSSWSRRGMIDSPDSGLRGWKYYRLGLISILEEDPNVTPRLLCAPLRGRVPHREWDTS